ncbi:MAG: efflux RND transporter permease subunit [bacterium]|nr:efflux RND transporter permease subunit [bacterium]
MKLAEVSINRPVFTTMVILALIVFGLVSLQLLGIDLFPNVDFPMVTVTTILPGADPETMETRVTDVIEEAVNTLSGIKTLRSSSSEGVSMVFIEFELEKNVDVVAQDVRDKVASIRSELPKDVEAPIVDKLDLQSSPIIGLTLSGDKSVKELTRFADKVVKERLQQIIGVGGVKIVGGRDRQIRVWLNANKMEAYQLSAPEVVMALGSENVDIPGGRIESEVRELVVKTKGEFESPTAFNDLVLTYRNGFPIKLKDIATIEDGEEDERSLSLLNGQRAVALLIRRQSGTNMVQVAHRVKAEIKKIQESLPPGMHMEIAQDMSTYTEESVRDIRFHIIFGGLLAIAIVFVFLRNIRTTLISAVAIPTSIIATFSFIKAMGFTLNMMTLLGLSLSVGMLIDDAIVVLENIYRHREEGMEQKEAARFGTAEIGLAVMATTFSIVAVFVPVAFMRGIVGRFFYEFGLTVTFAVLVSLFVSFTLTPMLSSRYLKMVTQHNKAFIILENFFNALDTNYRKLLTYALSHRRLVIVSAIIIFIGSLGLTLFIGKEFEPPYDRGEFNIVVRTPLGSSLAETARIVQTIEQQVKQYPEVKYLFTTIGGGEQERVDQGTIFVKLIDRDKRKRSQQELMQLVREQFKIQNSVKISVEEAERIGAGFRAAMVQFNIRGPNLQELQLISNRIIAELKDTPGFVDVDSSFESGKPELRIYIDREKAADLGVSVGAIASTIQTLIGGQKATDYKEAGDRYEVRVRLEAVDRQKASDINRLIVKNKDGKTIQLVNVVKIEEGTGPVEIQRQNRQRQITVLSNLVPGKPLGTAVQEVKAIADKIGIPPGYTTDFTGMAEIMAESFTNIGFALVLAIIVVYMILASQFESFIHPFTIMLSLPLSIVGALGALLLTGKTLNIFSLIGIIMLMGLVTKNAILLVDYTNTLRKRGMERNEALLKAGPVRLRPILMTTAAMIFGMLPIALGLGSGGEIRSPMAVCVIGGLITSTMLTLIVVPVVYTILDDLGRRKKNIPSETS